MKVTEGDVIRLSLHLRRALLEVEVASDAPDAMAHRTRLPLMFPSWRWVPARRACGTHN